MFIAGNAEVLKRGTGPCATSSATKPAKNNTVSSPAQPPPPSPRCEKPSTNHKRHGNTQRSNPRNVARTVL